MATHHFAINVPNPTARAEAVELKLEPVTTALPATGLALPEGKLHVEHAGITLDPCGAGGRRTLQVKLEPFSSVTVTAVVTTTPNRKGGAATFHVVDRRRKRVVGGVTLACADPPLLPAPAQTLSVLRPCPVTLATTPYTIAPNADPSKPPLQTDITVGIACDFVAPLINRTKAALHNVQAYLEHLGGSDAAFTPIIWNIGTLVPEEQIFYATWPVRPTGEKTGVFKASIVVSSDRTDPTRLQAPLSIR
jgi:hypothetical protein